MRTFCLTFLLFFCASAMTHAQDIKFKKGNVLVDGSECMHFSTNANVAEFNTLDGNNTILLKTITTGVGANNGMYTKVIFVEQDRSFTSRTYMFNKKLLIKKLIQDEVMVDCKIDESKIDKFLMRYDEGIEETLIRH